MTTPTDKKKYNKMEKVLNYINSHYVTVVNEDIKKANPVLKHTIDTIVEKMKEVSPLFKSLFESILYGGSYYDGLKVGKPEEFDIDLRMSLPALVESELKLSNQPGFVTIQMPGWAKFEKSDQNAKYKDLAQFKDTENYLIVDKVLKWMESIVDLALNKIGRQETIARIPYNGKYVEVTMKKSGPAVTALISYNGLKIDVDLVACFKMSGNLWPPSPFRPLPTECNGKRDFMIVPKAPKVDCGKKERCWRMSFQEQERVLINDGNRIKPALKLLKKLRDTQNHKMISSYFLKTVFLHEIDKQDKSFWNESLSLVFMHMMKTYRDYLQKENIPYYWNKNNNLLKHIDKTTIGNFKNYLTRVIDNVDRKIEADPFVIGEYLSTPAERAEMKEVNIEVGKKNKTEQVSVQASSLAESSNLVAVLSNILTLHDAIGPTNTVKVQSTDKINSTENNKSNNEDKNSEILLSANSNYETDSSNQITGSEIISATAAESSKNSELLSMLKGIQKSVNNLQTDMKKVLEKVSSLETSVVELKTDSKYLKSVVANSGVAETHKDCNSQNNANDFEMMLEKINNLDRIIQDIKAENDVLKAGLKPFVMTL